MIVSEDILKGFGVENEEEFAAQIKERNKNTLIGQLDMEYVELTPDRVMMTMPIGPKTWQPAGILHGGASVALAETAATIATAINIDPTKFNPVGMEINANHIRVKAMGTLLQLPHLFIKDGPQWSGILKLRTKRIS